MSEDHYRLFKALAITLALIVAALYFRYGYLSPHFRFDRWTHNVQTLTPDGTWVRATMKEPQQ